MGEALAEPMAVVLASPGFLYLNAPQKAEAAHRVLSDLELASRLSYFVWSSAPDDALLGSINDAGCLTNTCGLSLTPN